MDTTNPVQPMQLAVGHTTSAAEQVASWARGAAVVKGSNSTGDGNMLDPGDA